MNFNKNKQNFIIISEEAISKNFLKEEILVSPYIVCKKFELMNIRNLHKNSLEGINVTLKKKQCILYQLTWNLLYQLT